MSYITAAEVKTVARITYDQLGFATDALYTTFLTSTLIPEAQDLIDNHVGHDFLLTSGTIRLDGSGKETQHVNRFGLTITTAGTLYPQLLPLPLVSVTGVSVDNIAIAGGAFQVYKTYVTYEDNYFTKGRQNVDIVAAWGYGTINGGTLFNVVPDDVKYVAGQVCANALRNMIKRWLAPQEITRIIMGGRTAGITALFAEDVVLTDGLQLRLDRYRFSDVAIA